VKSHWPVISAWLLVAGISAIYTALCSLAAAAVGLPWWLGILPVALTLAGAETAILLTEGTPVKQEKTVVIEPGLSPRLHAVTDRLCQLTGDEKPELRLMDMAIPNALAYTPKGGRPTIYVTSGLLEKLDNPQLETVLAHELAHVGHRDQKVLAFAKAMIGWLMVLPGGLFMLLGKVDAAVCGLAHRCGFAWKSSFDPRMTDELRRRYPEPTITGSARPWVVTIAVVARTIVTLTAFAMIVALVGGTLAAMVIGAPGLLAVRLLTRRRELAADRAAAEVTKAPATLAAALSNLSSGTNSIPKDDLRALGTASSLAILPFDRSEGPLSSHPTVKRRIHALTALSRTQ
jgi:heat shock protein HtpX